MELREFLSKLSDVKRNNGEWDSANTLQKVAESVSINFQKVALSLHDVYLVCQNSLDIGIAKGDNGNSISIVWGIEDIQEVCPSISDEDARKVPQFLKKNHDSNIGINWEVIESAVRYLRIRGDLS